MKISLEMSLEEFDALPANHPLRASVKVSITPKASRDIKFLEVPKRAHSVAVSEETSAAQLAKDRETTLRQNLMSNKMGGVVFPRLTTPYYAAVGATLLEDQVYKDTCTIRNELSVAGITIYRENTHRCDPVKLAVYRALPMLVGVIYGYILYRYGEVWIAFSKGTNFVNATVQEIVEQTFVFYGPEELKLWADAIHVAKAEQQRSELLAEYSPFLDKL